MTDNFLATCGTVGAFVHDALLAGENPPIVTGVVTLASGAGALIRGTVLGKITASGEFQTCDVAAEDGSQDPLAILSADADASTSAVKAPVYLTGAFNPSALTLGGDTTSADVADALRDRGIFLKSVLGA
jgi:hypothetical protein